MTCIMNYFLISTTNNNFKADLLLSVVCFNAGHLPFYTSCDAYDDQFCQDKALQDFHYSR